MLEAKNTLLEKRRSEGRNYPQSTEKNSRSQGRGRDGSRRQGRLPRIIHSLKGERPGSEEESTGNGGEGHDHGPSKEQGGEPLRGRRGRLKTGKKGWFGRALRENGLSKNDSGMIWTERGGLAASFSIRGDPELRGNCTSDDRDDAFPGEHKW